MICKKIKATKETYFDPFIEGLYRTEMDEIHHNGTITNKNRCMIVVSWIVNRYALSIDNKIVKNYSVGNFVHSAHGKYGTDSLCIEISNKSLKFIKSIAEHLCKSLGVDILLVTGTKKKNIYIFEN